MIDCKPYLVTLIGILLILPLIGVPQLGTITDGIASWVIAIAVLILGIKLILKK